MLLKAIPALAAAFLLAGVPFAAKAGAGEGACASPAYRYLTTDDLAGDGGEGKRARVDGADLIGRKFVLSKVDGKAFAAGAGAQPFIAFGEGMQVSGSACNRFRGPGTLADGVLTVPNAASTRRMCINTALAEFEGLFHARLRGGVAVALDGGTLTLTGGGGTLEYVEER